ncbi:hypothetical protein [Pseudozobellia thermophila]|uniref:Zinc-finger n=1 Tax=Pseudozobellia thermophila TaxID=192903 RepID=A0A1M6LSU4_9FLAO|nr:hypothetical protein [Pseudozobellia thermophila]SHJ74172.1 hypothetical protein SAMN04488513_10835 [Pseudozobellia thermophila]
MISCEKAAIICNKIQYKEATFIEKLKLRYHLLMCETCTKFSKKNSQLTSLCNKAHLHGLSNKEKEQMKDRLRSKS